METLIFLNTSVNGGDRSYKRDTLDRLTPTPKRPAGRCPSLMDQRGLLVLLLTGSALVSGPRAGDVIKRYHHVPEPMTWTQARLHCRANFADLATVEDRSRGAEARRATGAGQKVWIGLHGGAWTWSSGEALDPRAGYRNWADGEPRWWRCAAMAANGQWQTADCWDRRPFFCSKGEGGLSQAHLLVPQRKNWTEAQAHCRHLHGDLSTVQQEATNRQLEDFLRPDGDAGSTSESAEFWANGGAWLGLHRSPWAWSDGSDASYRRWGEAQQQEGAECVMMETTPSEWVTRPCGNKHSVLCQSVGSVSVTLRVRLSSSADLSDAAAQESVRLQVEQKLTERGVPQGLTLRWTMVHKEEEEEEEEEEESSCQPLQE